MRRVYRNALFALLAVALGAAAFTLAPSAATTTTNIAYTDESGSLYLASTAAAGMTTLYTNDGTASVQALGITPNGQDVLVATPDTGGLALVATGGGTPVAISGTDNAMSGSLSPDGKTALFATSDGIYTVPIAGGTASQVLATPAGSTDSLPVFSPSGKQIAFARDSFDADDNETVTLELFTVAGATTSDLATDLMTDLESGGRIAFSPDGKTLVYAGGYDNTGIFTVPVAGGTATQLTTDTDLWPSFSLDGTKIFFARDALSTNADDQATTPVSPTANDVSELWSMATNGDSPAVIQEGDYETLVLASKSTTGTTTTTGSTTGSTKTTTTTNTTTGTTTTSTTTGTTGTTTTTKSATGGPHSIGLSVTGHRYKVTWTGTAAHWKVTLRVGKKTSTVTVKGSVHSHVFTVTAKGTVSVRVAAA
jgi:WD40-like Beta Propeller Repeat